MEVYRIEKDQKKGSRNLNDVDMIKVAMALAEELEEIAMENQETTLFEKK
jgi:hypothetical protein